MFENITLIFIIWNSLLRIACAQRYAMSALERRVNRLLVYSSKDLYEVFSLRLQVAMLSSDTGQYGMLTG